MLENVTLTLLINLIFMFSTGQSSCTYSAVGEKVVISFDGAKLQEGDELRWTHDEVRVYFKKGSKVKVKELDVDEDGSLILTDVQKDKSGEYKGIIYDSEGSLIKETVQQLCVLEPVSEPTVVVECVEKGVNLTCSAENNREVLVSWTKNGITTDSTLAFLHFLSSEIKSGDSFSCTVSNQISQKSAKEVQPACSDAGLYATTANYHKEKEANSSSANENKKDVYKKKFLGLDLWLMLVILTGGGSFLVLSIICLVCFCRCYRRNKRKAKEEEEYRLTSLMPDHTNPPDVQYMQQITSERSSKSQRPLPPLPGPQGPPCVGPP
ncbi:T-cell surface antigen CD2-like [Puntigrus tetrazona]|uniref:T-cell surface antigen CD2-like n=1 Tax=Puntigrus tetrazona TaxID=1606681 RepID=UPI001C8A6FDE|nr:T-cell surface antigen CD2-like [Puntigrus tetrazona]